jgi:HK97 family phage portal protein
MSEVKVTRPGWIKSTLLQWLGVPISLINGEFWSQWSSYGSFTGKRITVNTALQLSTVWACVRLIAETISTLPLFMYQINTNGSRSLIRTHQLFDLLHSQPNGDMTAVVFWESVVASMLLWGNAYCEIVRNAGTIIALNFLDPARMFVRRLPDGSLEYRYTDWSGLYVNDSAIGGKTRVIAETDMMHVPAFTTNGILGLSPVAYGANVFGTSIATDQSSADTFRNAMRSPGLITMDMILKKDQREEIREHVKKVSEAGGVMVLEKGSGFQKLTFNPEDAQLLASREFNISEICRWFRVPPYMVGHTEKSTAWGTGMEQQQISFVTFVLRPWLVRIEQAVKKSLLTPVERTKYFAEFSLDALMRADSTGRAALYSSAAQNGWMSRNEIRELENLAPIAGGDELTAQSNLLPVGMLGRIPVAPQVPVAVAA